MKKIYILFALFNLVIVALSAQTLDQARAWYNEGDYEQAKPVFEKMVKSQPGNGNYNLWYGVCCMKTGDPQEALKYLKSAVQKRVPSGQLYLAQNYDDLYMFEDAIKTYEAYISDLTKRKRPTEEAEALLDKSKVGLRMLRSVEEVCIIDSVVIDKANFLSAYRIGEETGRLYTYNEFFQTTGNHPGTVYETELRNKIYFGQENAEGILNIYSKNKLGNDWSDSYELPERINGSGDTNYPFVMTDGITTYFASTGDNSIGGYDIFVTRYNSASDTYLTPENIGMPFNSPFNDYMLVIDEFNNLGWFASDRYQPEDSVCIYVFIPNESKRSYNYEGMETEAITKLARIQSIQDTWADETELKSALKRLETVIYQQPKMNRQVDFNFVIDDKRTYNYLSDFKSVWAKDLFQKYQQKEADLHKQEQKLQELRDQYQKGNSSTKAKLAPSILDLEARNEVIREELYIEQKEIRNAEKQTVK